jgi:hypothetical protein
MSAEPEIQYDEFKTLAVAGDIEAMRKMVADGMDLNDDLDDDTTLLEEVIGEICAAEGTPFSFRLPGSLWRLAQHRR